jgi:rhodanese-related sulfurtransferase
VNSTTDALAPEQVRPRLDELTVVDVRSPGEYASGHLPGAHNIPLDQLRRALPALETAAARGGGLLMVCASGTRSDKARATLAEHGIPAATLTGGTVAWARGGGDLHHPAGARATWAMERQVRLTAGSLVLLGLAVGRRASAARLLSAGIGVGLVYSALTDTCGMAAVLSRLPHNRSGHDLDATLADLGR